MPYATTSALVDAVRQYTDWSGGTDTQILDMVNRVHFRIQREHDFTFQEQVASASLATATAGFSRFATPTDLKEMLNIYNVLASGNIELNYSDFGRAIVVFNQASAAVHPTDWSIWRDEIVIFPALNSAINAQMYYYRFLPDLSATSSDNFLNLGSDALFYGTLYEYSMFMGESQRKQEWQELHRDAVGSLLRYHRSGRVRPYKNPIPNTPGRIGNSTGQ